MGNNNNKLVEVKLVGGFAVPTENYFENLLSLLIENDPKNKDRYQPLLDALVSERENESLFEKN